MVRPESARTLSAGADDSDVTPPSSCAPQSASTQSTSNFRAGSSGLVAI